MHITDVEDLTEKFKSLEKKKSFGNQRQIKGTLASVVAGLLLRKLELQPYHAALNCSHIHLLFSFAEQL